MLALSNLSLDFGGAPAVEDLSLTVGAGEFVVLLGPSGCGKTTLLRLASGALTPTSGRVESTFARTAMVFQDPRLLPWMDAADNAAFGLKALGVGRAERRGAARRILQRLDFSSQDMDKRPAALSGGMRQRVAIARALAVEPGLLLMDEPFAALDVGLRRRLQDMVRAETDRAGLAALFVTHDVWEAVRLASRIVVLSPRPGRIVAEVENTPVADPARILEGAAALLRRPEIEMALFAPAPVEAGPEVVPAADPSTCTDCERPVCRTT